MASRVDQDEVYARLMFVQSVREYLQDRAEVNTLHEGEQFSDAQIHAALQRTINDVYNAPPLCPTPTKVKDFTNHRILLLGTVSDLLETATLRSTANDLDFVAGSVSVRYTQPERYWQLARTLRAEYRADVDRWKTALNARRGLNSMTFVNSDANRLPNFSPFGYYGYGTPLPSIY